jgi:plasmid segregation protein ParM
MKSQQEYMKNVSTIYLFSQFLLNFPSMPFSSDFRMLIPQQSSTTPVRPAESINTKTEVFFMRELKNTKIIAVDAVEYSLKQALPLFLSGLTAGMVQREPQIRASFPAPENSLPDSDVDWDFLGE